MRNLTHPRHGANLALFAALLALGACTSGPWERSFWHPPAAQGAAPIESGKTYPIARAEGTAKGWPNLADVPARQEAPLTPEQASAALHELEADRASSGQPSAATLPAQADLPGTPPSVPPEIQEE